ncbi:glycosyltransferase family 2 protein [Natronoflexus pectinivorans]|uniref:Glycosyltransferase 2-like domain-containing protein n=1 Tax=Natronoflexus pectinivorans TaxID=682526 RepID=A0A4V6NMP3_9BACT|nr:glycosyltransferase family 2 protein [Natronoflexus pectinivorans]TCO06894.1 hypothetical protein EV194_11110 [Natronoflexus pectinivorans]
MNKQTNISPKISIITVTFNCADVIEDNIKSCLNEPDTEIIMVDNHSQDETARIIEPYIGKKLKLIRNKTNNGFTEGNNIGIRAANGQYIMFLNPDASLQPGTLHKMAEYLDEHPETGAVAPSLLYPNGTLQNYTRRFPAPCGLWVESFVPQRWWNRFSCYRKYTCQDISFSTPREVEQPAGAAIMFRNQWLLDEYYFNYVSDVDLCKTIIKDGYNIIQLPHIHILHHQSKGGTENREIRTILDLDNYYGMRYYFKKHQQTIDLFCYNTLFGISLFLRFFISLFQGKKQIKNRWFKLRYFIFPVNTSSLYDNL